MHVTSSPPVGEDEYRALRARLYRLHRDHPESWRANEALEDVVFPLAREFGDWYALEILNMLFVRWWLRDHPRVPWWPDEALLLEFCREHGCLILLAVQAIPPEPGRPGRPDDAIVHVSAAPLVRAHALLTAAPPCFRAPVLAGAAPA